MRRRIVPLPGSVAVPFVVANLILIGQKYSTTGFPRMNT